MKQFYIKESELDKGKEFLTIKEILIQPNLNEIAFKFMDSCLVFRTDGKHIFATDIEDDSVDVFDVEGELNIQGVRDIFEKYELAPKERLSMFANQNLWFTDRDINNVIEADECVYVD